VGCPLQPDLVNTSCSESCAPDAVRACGRAVHLTHELAIRRSSLHRSAHPSNYLHPSLSLEMAGENIELTYGLRYETLCFA